MPDITVRWAAGIVAVIWPAAAAFGQSDSLALSSATTTAGGMASLTLSLTSPAGSQPAGLQWTVSYPTSDVTAVTATAGAASTAAGKTILCAAKPGAYTCLLSGLNENTIQNGVAAIVNITLSASATTAPIGITTPVGASPVGQAIPVTATGGTVSVGSGPTLSTLTCNPASLPSGSSSTCTVTLNQAAPSLGTAISLSSNNTALSIPSAVTVPGGASSAAFTASAGTVTSTQSATVTASLNGTSKTFNLSLLPLVTVTNLACTPTSLNAGSSSTCTVTLSAAAPSGGVTLSLSSSSPVLTVPASVTVPASSSTGSFTLTTESTLPSGESQVTVTASLNGATQSASFTVTICPCSIWTSTAQPLNPGSRSKKAIEVGVKFTTDIAAYVTGVRFYKESSNTGTHVGNLWSSTGTNLATVTFSSETASGWQVAYFPSPVTIAANSTYVISYYAPNGHNAADNGFFTNNGVDSAPLHALSDGQNGPDGVYANGSGGFPSTGASGTNYWVDVVLNTSPTIGLVTSASLWAPTAVPKNPAASTSQPAQLGLTFLSDVPGYITGLRFYKSLGNAGTHTGYLWTSSGALLASVTFANESASGWQQANFSSPVPIDANTPFVISYWSPKGYYADDAGYFATSGITNQMLYAPPGGQYGPNGACNTSDAFPGSDCGTTNYWVDVVFTTAIQ